MWKKTSLTVFVVFYAIAGINHFINPGTYEELIPSYLGKVSFLNLFAGIAEIVIAIAVIFKPTRLWAGRLTIIMLLLFTISHVYFIQKGHCAGDICLDPWIGWVRLVVIHPLLIYWAYKVSTY